MKTRCSLCCSFCNKIIEDKFFRLESFNLKKPDSVTKNEEEKDYIFCSKECVIKACDRYIY